MRNYIKEMENIEEICKTEARAISEKVHEEMNKKYRRLGECCAQQMDEVRRAILEIKKRAQQEASKLHPDHDQELLELAKGQ